MAKLTRVIQKIFASTAATTQIGQFGSLAAGAPVTTTDPVAIQGLANFLGGWFSAILGANSPAIEDMNALGFLLTRQLAYLFQQGVPEWEVGTTYYAGSLVNYGGLVFKSVTDNNTGNAVTDPANWIPILGAITAVTANYTAVFTDQMVEADATTAAGGILTVTLPTAASSKSQRKTITKMDTSTNPVTIVGGTLTVNLLAQYDSTTVFSNGTVWYQI